MVFPGMFHFMRPSAQDALKLYSKHRLLFKMGNRVVITIGIHQFLSQQYKTLERQPKNILVLKMVDAKSNQFQYETLAKKTLVSWLAMAIPCNL